jgi:hypothetical protein
MIASETPIVLQSERLTVTIAAPGSMYRGTRFDWTGFVTQVVLDAPPFGAPGRGGPPRRGHTFCVVESYVPGQGTGGVGLCNEFGIELPVGYDDASPGESFPKLGIGLLTRPDDAPYNFFRPYLIAELFPVVVETTATQATFTVAPLECRGYAARLVKTVTVNENELTVAYVLENVGQKPLVTHEYCHNFMGIDSHPIGPDYVLRTPYPITLEPLGERMGRMASEDLEVVGGELRCRVMPQHQFYARLQGFSRTDMAQWELTHKPSGVTLKEYDDFTPVRVAVWGAIHVISAEVFVGINVQPGAMQRWTRRYTFSG